MARGTQSDLVLIICAYITVIKGFIGLMKILFKACKISSDSKSKKKLYASLKLGFYRNIV